MEFSYRARTRSGDLKRGSISAPSKQEAASLIRGDGLLVVEITEGLINVADTEKEGQKKNEDGKSIKKSLFDRRPKTDDLMMFSRQMFTLLRGGVTLLNSVSSMIPYIENAIMREVLKACVRDLESGYTFYQAMSRHKEYIPDIMLGMIRAGEETGNMENIFERLAQHFEKEKETRERIKSVVRYPIIVMTVILIALMVMNVMVIPVFAKIFDRFSSDLPLMTVILISTSDFIVNQWRTILVGSGIFYVVWGRWVKTKAGRYSWDRWKLKIPIFGHIMHQLLLSRLCHSISMIFASGMPIIQGLAIAGQSTGNVYFSKKIQQMSQELERGGTMPVAAEKTRLFHPLAMQMLVAGEMTGSLDDTLSRVAYYYEREVDNNIKSLGEKMEPFLIFGIGVMVLVLALGIFIPLWDMSSVIMGKTH